MIHVYGFVDASSQPPPVEGLANARVETLPAGPLAAVVSRHGDALAATEDAIVRHAQVVEAALRACGAVLPARYGTAYADEHALADAVRGSADSLQARLTALDGCVELALRVLHREEPDPAGDGSGAEYMHRRLREHRERAQLVARLDDELGGLVRETAHRVPQAGPVLLHAAFLVRGELADEVQRRIARLGAEHRGLTLVVTGPWPPYSFAEAA